MGEPLASDPSRYMLPASGRTGLSYLSRTKTADVVCYLDFDGVLHHEAAYRHPKRGVYIDPKIAPGHSLFEYAHHLVEAFTPYPDLKIVLSTSWVRVLGYTRTRKYLPVQLAERVIGATYHSNAHGMSEGYAYQFSSMTRGEQVWADVLRRQPRRWLAIDDAVDDWPDKLRDNLVPCAGEYGLGDPHTRDVLAQRLVELHQLQD